MMAPSQHPILNLNWRRRLRPLPLFLLLFNKEVPMQAYRITLTGPFSRKLNRPLEREYLVHAQARTLFERWFYHTNTALIDHADDWFAKILWLH